MSRTPSPPTPGKDVVFGRPEEWAAFQKRNPVFLETYPELHRLMTATFIRVIKPAGHADTLVFHLGNLCREDFLEIMLLAGNGYGLGALRLLRGMYERAVNARYISQNPTKADDFFEFGQINIYKTMEALKRVGAPINLPQETADAATAMHQRFKAEGRSSARWSGSLSFDDMAMQVGGLGKMIVNAYIVPTQQLHSSIQAIVSRLVETEKGFSFDGEAQRERSDEALQYAQLILLSVIDLQATHFGLAAELGAMLEGCMLDFKRAWPSPASAAPSS